MQVLSKEMIEGLSMSRRRSRASKQTDKDKIIEMRNEIAQRTSKGIVLFLSLLIIPCVILIFNIGNTFYSSWLITHRAQIIGVLLLAITIVALSSPLIVEVNSNPRPLSGPGKNPHMDPWGYIDSDERK
jgi:predicted ferric reductase